MNRFYVLLNGPVRTCGRRLSTLRPVPSSSLGERVREMLALSSIFNFHHFIRWQRLLASAILCLAAFFVAPDMAHAKIDQAWIKDNLPGGDQIKVISLEAGDTFAKGQVMIRGKAEDVAMGNLRAARVLMWRVDRFKPASIHDDLDRFPLNELTVPEGLMVLSSAMVSAIKVKDLPEGLGDFAAKVLKNDDAIPMNMGLNMFGRIEPDSMPGKLKDALKLLGVQKGAVLLGGGVGNIVSRKPKPEVKLYAELPGYKFPEKLAKVIGPSKDAKPKLSFASKGKNAVLGVAMPLELNVGSLKAAFTGKIAIEGSPASMGFKVTGKRQKWTDALGIQKLNLSDVIVQFGVSASGTASVALQGGLKIDGKVDKLMLAAGASPIAPIDPKALIFGLRTQKISLDRFMKVADIFVATGSGDIAQKAKNPGLFKAMQLNKLPSIKLKGLKKDEPVEIYLSGPKASNADLHVTGIGAKAKAILDVEGNDLAIVDANVGLSGMDILGEVIPNGIGPLKLEKARLVTKASLSEVPSMEINTSTDLFGYKQALDIKIGDKGYLFRTENRIAEAFGVAYEAKTLRGFKLEKSNDFVVKGIVDQDFMGYMHRVVKGPLNDALKVSDENIEKAKAEIDKAEAKLKKTDKDLLKAKRDARKKLDKAVASLEKAQAKVNKLKRKIRHHKKKARAYNRKASDLPKRKFYKKGYWRAKAACQKALATGLKVARRTADKVLKAAKRTVDKMPVDLAPKVVAMRSALETAKAGVKAAKFALNMAQAGANMTQRVLVAIVEEGDITNVLSVSKAELEGRLTALLRGNAPFAAGVNGRFLGSDFDFDLKVNPRDAKSWAGQVGEMGKKLASKLGDLAKDPKRLVEMFRKSVVEETKQRLAGKDLSDKSIDRMVKRMTDDGLPLEEAVAELRDNPEARRSYINDLYREIMGRDGDKGGLDHYVNLMNKKGWTYDQVRDELMLSPEGRPKYVTSLYRKHLYREPDKGGLNFYVGQLAKGVSPEQIEKEISFSPEGLQAKVVALYDEILEREPDRGGLDYWVGKLKDGMSPADVRASFLQSDEYRTRLITGIYQDVLARDPDSGGLKHYLGKMKKGYDIDEISEEIFNSDEGLRQRIKVSYQRLLGRDPDKGGWDFYFKEIKAGKKGYARFEADLMNSDEARKRAITDLYQQALGRDPDANGLKHYMGELAKGKPLEDIDAILTSSEEGRKKTVTDIYEEELRRKPDGGGLRHYAGKLKSGTSVEDIRKDIRNSDEWRRLMVRDLYLDELGRAPDKGGLKFWADKLKRKDLVNMRAEFRKAAEAELKKKLKG